MEADVAIKNDMQVRGAKLPQGKMKAKFAVGGGLFLLVTTAGKYWKYAYTYNDKRREASLGVYPAVSMKVAKVKLSEIKALLAEGIDPNQQKRDAKMVNRAAAQKEELQAVQDANTFERVARQWHTLHESGWSDKHAKTILRRFELHVFPTIGSIPVSELKKTQVADVLTAIAERGTVEIAKRIGQITRQALDYAADRGLIDAIPMGNTKNLIPTRKAKPMPAITDSKRIGELLRAIYAYEGSFIVCQALKLLPLVALRSGEFRTAEWIEINLDDGMWTIPATHRKLTKVAKADPANVHQVPLSTQAVAILNELQQLTGRGRHVFPSVRGDIRPMSENAVNVAIHAMGFDDMVGHGWRAVFSTSLNQQGFNPDAIERQLAHTEKNAVRAAYNRSDYLDERKSMMQHWADYLDGLRTGADVIPINRRA